MEVIWTFIKFCLVGGSGVLVDFGVTFLGKEMLKLNKYVANSIGFIIAATSNYVLNRFFTFASKNPHFLKEYTLFLGFSLIGLFINNGIIYFLHAKCKWNFYFSKLFAIGVVTLWNFFMNYFFTF
jgi:putative flippase GtrA